MKTAVPEAQDLDAIDRRILAELQADGRMTNVELARRAGISAPPCLRRVRRLEEAGIIRGYHADSDPQKLGWEIIFFAIVGLESQKEVVLSGFERLDAQVGQSITAGSPVGVMPGWDPRAAAGRPSLSVELRHAGEPINPLPFLG